MSNSSSPSLAAVLAAQFHRLQDQIQSLDTEAIARRSGFLHRTPRKIPIPKLTLGLVALAAELTLSLERIAAVIGLAAGCPYSKQALSKRITAHGEAFLGQVTVALFGRLSQGICPQGLFGTFRRVLLHDSTVERLPEHLAPLFPGGRNQRPVKRAALKIQFIADLLHSTVMSCSLSGYTRNDQAAAADILTVAQAGDLILRDLGYFALPVLEGLDRLKAFFLSRYKHGVRVYDLAGRPLDLVQWLRTHGRLDQEVLLGEKRVRLRLVALPVPEALANARRRKARAHHDGR